MKTLHKNQRIFSLLTITIIMLSVGSISSYAHATSLKPLEHQGKPLESDQAKQTHHFEILNLLKTEFKNLKTFVHMDDFSLAHKSSHV